MRPMRTTILFPLFFVITTISLLSFGSLADDIAESEVEMTCPESCKVSRRNCELSCSQIVGGGAKAEKRRECSSACDDELVACNLRCANPTPRPTLKPEPYHDKSCSSACEFKRKDCNEACTKYTGGGAKSAKKTACIRECTEKLDQCKDWCVNPTPRPTPEPTSYKDNPCAEACRVKRIDCEETCTIYVGGGADGGKQADCLNECREINNACMGSCVQ